MENILKNISQDTKNIDKYLPELLEYVNKIEDNKICYTILPELVNYYIENNNKQLLSIIAKLKSKAMLSNPNNINIKILMQYLESVLTIVCEFSNQLTPEDLEENNIDISTAYRNICYGHFFATHSTDAIGYYNTITFNKPIPTKCCNCGDEVLDFEVTEDNITPINQISFDAYNSDVIWRMEGLQNLDLMGISDEMYLLYGSYICNKCNKENTVIKAHANYFLTQNKYTKLTKTEIEELDTKINNNQITTNNYSWNNEFLVFTGEYIANLYWDSFGNNCLYPYIRLLGNSIKAYEQYGGEYIKMIVASADNAITNNNCDDNKLLGDIYYMMNKALDIIDYSTDEEKQLSKEYKQKSDNYYCK